MANTSTASKGTVIVTGGSQGSGAAIVKSFLDRGYAAVATSRKASQAPFAASANLALVDGDISKATTSQAVTEAAISRFGSIDHVVANASIFIGKPFLKYTAEDYQALVSTNLEGFLNLAQLAVKQMPFQGRGGSVTSITAASADSPNTAAPSAVDMHRKQNDFELIRLGSAV